MTPRENLRRKTDEFTNDSDTDFQTIADELENLITDIKPSPLGERLVVLQAITQDQLQIALHEQRQNGKRIGEVLVGLGFLDETALAEVLADRAGLEPVDLKQTTIDPALLRQLPRAVAMRHQIVPLAFDGTTLNVAMADPYDILALDEMRRYFPRPIHVNARIAPAADIRETLLGADSDAGSLDEILRKIETENTASEPVAEVYQHPVIQLVNALLFDAARQGASDIHLEPESNFVRVRYRIDGHLRQVHALHLAHWPALSHRIKIMAGMNIADTRSIQDGRFQLQISGHEVDFRVAIMPSVWGETIVVRLLDHRRSLLPLEELGFSNPALSALAHLLQKPQGITLVTGPTGSGKTTTLYSLLRLISTPEVNIATLEEPVEYQLDLIRQTAIHEDQGLDFAAGVRGVLRMDPDIIFIGEIRDAATAQMALRAAMTGHQVFSTLHCNDALSALPRLLDLGLSARALTGNLNGVIAQRLVRKLCPSCKTWRRASSEESRLLLGSSETPRLAEAQGCAACDHIGTRGRTALAEVLCFSPELDDMIAQDAARGLLMKQAQSEGFVRMQEDGLARVAKGEISLADLRRAVDLTRGF
ncbi:MAG: type II/IV secretion system protein [Alphaproteobacteria bacterium]|nr:type II/IV secretion system protein [Alphaproteobacteria bacterium]